MSRKPRKRHLQLTLDRARRACGQGGWRPNAGRPKTSRCVPHARRESIAARYPQHVTQHVVMDLPSLRKREVMEILRRSISRAHREDFRVVEFVVESNHLHLIIEAANNEARARGLKGLKVSIAKRLNRLFGRSGKLFEDRYHARALKTPREVRNALRYVLNNTRHHDPLGTEILDASWIDPCSSAAWFDGWAESIKPDTRWKRELLAMPPPTRGSRDHGSSRSAGAATARCASMRSLDPTHVIDLVAAPTPTTTVIAPSSAQQWLTPSVAVQIRARSPSVRATSHHAALGPSLRPTPVVAAPRGNIDVPGGCEGSLARERLRATAGPQCMRAAVLPRRPRQVESTDTSAAPSCCVGRSCRS